MNKTFKIIIAVIGAVNVIFSIFIPISLCLILATMYRTNWFSFSILILAGSLSSLYRAIKVAGIENIEYLFEIQWKTKEKKA